ncbi:hypothetical protein BH11BAC7_BH11BAC7_30890 [soil metagenome]
MNLSTRTNQALHIGQLISQVIMPLSVLNGNPFPPADGTIPNARLNDSIMNNSGGQVASQNSLSFEERDPVRSTERVPECSSNQTERILSASTGASAAQGTTDPFFQHVEAA